ncbi:hypothetical protein AURDEDRAFT_43547, partial [Auricularia subglabra TFB-10046 SS5]
MRESNFAFPAQNRACVCISSQLYDRRALDTTSALPLFNSLSHLTYLTSTSPRIREILTFDGGLERLAAGAPADVKNFDRAAAYRFSLAFQCVANIGVRGSEPIRSRQAAEIARALERARQIQEASSLYHAVQPAAPPVNLPRRPHHHHHHHHH